MSNKEDGKELHRAALNCAAKRDYAGFKKNINDIMENKFDAKTTSIAPTFFTKIEE